MSNETVAMKIVEDPNRVIGSREHNVHVASGINIHRPTTVAPTPLIAPLTDAQAKAQADRQKAIESNLRDCLGLPTYSGQGFILYQGECVELLNRLATSPLRFNLTITSPPYNIGKEYEHTRSVDEYVDWCGQWMTAIHRVTSTDGAFWLNLGYFEIPNQGLCVPISYLVWDRSPFYLLQEVVWAYGAGVSARQRLSPRNEKWLYFVRDPGRYTFNLDDIRDPNVKYPNQKKNGKFRCNPLGKNPSDVWEFPKVTTGKMRSSKERTAHPAQFPLAVVERIVRAASNSSDVLLDPFAGSCSTGIAAAALGRVFVGFEVREDYCRLAVERFEKFLAERRAANGQSTLF